MFKKPGKSEVTKQIEIFNSVQGKGPIDWAVVLILTSWPNLKPLPHILSNFETSAEHAAAQAAYDWMVGDSTITPAEYMGYDETQPEPPMTLRRKIWLTLVIVAIFSAYAWMVGRAVAGVQ